MAWTDRKSESFVLTPLHCGSKGTGYAQVTAMTRDHLSIGRAIAISGASVDPNMNYHQSPTLTAFLTIFNARLGYWIENPLLPAKDDPGSRSAGPAEAVRKAILAATLARSRVKDEQVHGRRRESHGRKRRVVDARLARARWVLDDARRAETHSLERARTAAAGLDRLTITPLSDALAQLADVRVRIARLEGEVARLEAEAARLEEETENRPATERDQDARAIDASIAALQEAEQALQANRPPAAAGGAASLWKAESPKHGGLLITELLGGTGREDRFVHLTDGGHFENTGVYELVRRRCRYIIACDANTDRTAADENLANLVRLVRIDFGIRIQIDSSSLKVGDDRTCRSHVVIGSVRYDDVDSGQVPGVLVYIRTSMTGDEPPDIQNYASVNLEFPYTSNVHQFFDEAQFESYRALGDHVACNVFEDARNDAERTPLPKEDAEKWFRRGNLRLFAALRRRWAESMPGLDTRFIESSQGYSELQRDLQGGGALRDLSLEVYPELEDPGPAPKGAKTTAAAAASRDTPEGRRVELHAVARMLQVMENTWVGLDLKSHPEAPISHGWWSVFRRWTSTPAFHRNWPILRPEFSTEFVRFVESRLGLVPEQPRTIPWSQAPERDRQALIAEFDREWPKGPGEFEGTTALSLGEMIGKAVGSSTEGPPVEMAWAIVQEPRPESDGGPAASTVRGIVLVFAGSSLHPQPDPDRPGVGVRKEMLELLVWIRRSHRGIGLGTFGMDAAIAEIEGKLDGARLYVRYPKVEDDTVSSMWKQFVTLYDFETRDGALADDNAALVLHLRDLHRDP